MKTHVDSLGHYSLDNFKVPFDHLHCTNDQKLELDVLYESKSDLLTSHVFGLTKDGQAFGCKFLADCHLDKDSLKDLENPWIVVWSMKWGKLPNQRKRCLLQ